MKTCPFCNIDFNELCNTLIEETNNFFVIPTKGSLCEGYVLIISKQHYNNMTDTSPDKKLELTSLINKYRRLFKVKFGKYPIIFEHGENLDNNSSNSVSHAHIHIVNHNYMHEEDLIKNMNFIQVDKANFFNKINSSYISYISPNEKYYISTNYLRKPQQMRIYIACDLGFENKYNWKQYNFEDNIFKTINALKQQK